MMMMLHNLVVKMLKILLFLFALLTTFKHAGSVQRDTIK